MRNIGNLFSKKDIKKVVKDSKEKEKKKTESFQLRHTFLGLFQGMLESEIYWYPFSDTPEFGVYEFKTRQSVENLIEQIEPAFIERFPTDDFIIEPFDGDNSRRLREVGLMMNEACKVMPIGYA